MGWLSCQLQTLLDAACSARHALLEAAQADGSHGSLLTECCGEACTIMQKQVAHATLTRRP